MTTWRYKLERIAKEQHKLELELLFHITAMRENRITWEQIGVCLGITKQAAYKRFATKVDYCRKQNNETFN